MERIEDTTMTNTTQPSLFKQNAAKYNRICAQLKKLGLDAYSGVVSDTQMPKHSHTIVCNYDVIVDSENFLADNPVIVKHLDERQTKIDAFYAKQAEAHAWANR